MLQRGDLVVKLPAARVAELLARDEGRAFTRGSDGPVMREWVRLRPDDEAECAAWMVEARAFVATESGSGGAVPRSRGRARA